MSMENWRHALRTAATIWNFDDYLAVDTRPTPTETWWAALKHFETADVCEAFSRLALTLKFRPTLAEIVAAAREAGADRAARERRESQDKVLRLAAPSQRSADGRVRAFDQAAQQWRLEQAAELEVFGRRHHVDGVELDAWMARLGGHGPFARRARELIASDGPGGAGAGGMLCDALTESRSDAVEVGDALPRSARGCDRHPAVEAR